MKKLTLDIEALEVTSFETAPVESEVGTVHAASDDERTLTCSNQVFCVTAVLSYVTTC